ncbi:phage portal protein [Stackebrandtia nassauensis]|uniref:Phage portal protein n=1 Tax=Stackebrandtia nassauensis (strain DSM 44728 / CIP 108903 / NRRL B-16338 / NBRC 102104 / LLR-40K-21) TaxID=446470 RepID=D3Q2D9_STANL|nr:phage portal protein [Stackebrandtia nassauensis]ADD43872.1 protein of unknown function DUF1483 [Stackebrandtia nassauensis DSM 44728]
MPTPTDTAVELLARLSDETERLDRIDKYLRGEHDGPYTPRKASREYKILAQRSVTNLLPLVVNGLAQSLYVDGYRSGDTDEPASAWRHWQHNGLDARQSAIHRAALSYGRAYVVVVPGKDAEGAEAVPTVRGYSPRRMIAAYADDDDEWPEYAVRWASATVEGKSGRRVWFYDDETVHVFTSTSADGGDLAPEDSYEHGAGVTPVVEFRHLPDLEGRALGEVEPLIALQDRANQSTFDLLVAQTFSSFKIRTVSGMAPKFDDDGNPVPLPVDAARLLMATDPDTKFSQLDETDLRPLLDSIDAAVRHMAVVSQTPPSDLLGQLVNLSAEAITAARDGANRRRAETQAVFGECWEKVLRLCELVLGGDADTSAQVSWRDMEGRSLAQIADALGKLAQTLEVPVEALWPRIPGVTQTDIEAWQRMRATDRAADPLSKLADHVNQTAGGDGGLDNVINAADVAASAATGAASG